VATASPLVLPQVDTVNWVRNGRLAARGTHAELLAADPDYRRFVTRELARDDPAPAGGPPSPQPLTHPLPQQGSRSEDLA
jgi:hypothetical protein